MNKTRLWMLAAIYNLQGQRLDTLQRGVNIIRGKKKIASTR